ncbi:alpha/beta hydrolase [Aquimarina sediminis]|uniref:alpha/beta hydrolase n=1 Tax=Aquimarina sediminis TaxID=2070536 RepID=UPI000CA04DD1|nr:alpha/beta fold hydrolase [Aquimarina sediminis]
MKTVFYVKRQKTFFLISFLVVLMSSFFVNGQEKETSIQLVDSIYSKELKQYRKFTTYLPKTYSVPHNRKHEYPIIYVLDGDKRKDLVNTIYQFLADNKRPMILEAIIVAIHQMDRSYELTPNKGTHFFNGTLIPSTMNMGGGDSFYAFMKNELNPEIQKRYRANNFVNLVGHSFGGLFALHIMQKNDDFIKGIVAIDPSLWWNNGYLVDDCKKYLENNNTTKPILFLAEAGPKEDNLHSKSIEKFSEIIKSNTTQMPNSKFRFYKDKNHYTVLIPAIQDGLTFLLEDQTFRHLDSRMTKEYIIDSFKKKSKMALVDIQPSNTRIVTYGDLCMIKKMPEHALEFYNWAIENGVPKNILNKKIEKSKALISSKD